MKYLTIWCIVTLSLFSLEIGEVPPLVSLQGEAGGTVLGKAWSSRTLEGKVHLLLYMDPDKADETEVLFKRLSQTSQSLKGYSSVAIINLEATWLPNKLIEAKLRKKQKSLKNMVYLFDKHRLLVKRWGLKDNDANVIILDPKMRVVYVHHGTLSPLEVEKIFQKLEATVKKG